MWEFLSTMDWTEMAPKIGWAIGVAVLVLGQKWLSHAKRYAKAAGILVDALAAEYPNHTEVQLVEAAMTELRSVLGVEMAERYRGYVETAAAMKATK